MKATLSIETVDRWDGTEPRVHSLLVRSSKLKLWSAVTAQTLPDQYTTGPVDVAVGIYLGDGLVLCVPRIGDN